MKSINITPINMTSDNQITTLADVNTNYHIVTTASSYYPGYEAYRVFSNVTNVGFNLGKAPPGWWQVDYNKDIHISKIEVTICSFITVTIYNTSGSLVAQQSNHTTMDNPMIVASFDFGQDTVGSKIVVNLERSYQWGALFYMKIYSLSYDHQGFNTKPADLAYGYV